MDTISQAALGGAVALLVAGGRQPRKTIIYGALIGTLPDLDVLLPFENDIQSMIQHRTWTHSWLVHLLLGPIIGVLIARFDQSLTTFRWIVVTLMVLLTHSALDAFTIYGTWLWWPFMSQPVMGGSVFIIDPLFTLPLLIALFVVWRRYDSQQAIRPILIALVASSLYLGWGLYAKDRVEGFAVASLARANLAYRDLTATPTPFNSVLWRIMAIDDEYYHEGFYSFLDDDTNIPFRSIKTNPGLAAEITVPSDFGALASFNHGYYKLSRDGDTVIASDLRMGTEPYFFFQFVVADTNGDREVPRQAVQNIDAGRLFGWLVRRFIARDVRPLEED